MLCVSVSNFSDLLYICLVARLDPCPRQLLRKTGCRFYEETVSYIETIAPESATGPLAEVYASINRRHGRVQNIWQAGSLDPDLLQKHLAMDQAVMFSSGGLTLLERHAVALTVWSANECCYGLPYHTRALREAGSSEDLVEALLAGEEPDTEPLRLRRIVYFARKLTLLPNSMSQRDVDDLRAAGMSDAEILHTVHIAGHFNHLTRLACALGVKPEDEEP
jgi:uncharacterized peroxidase-related enzyme